MEVEILDFAGTCYSSEMVTTNGIWGAAALHDFSLPLFVLCSTLVIVTSHFFTVLLKPFRQPRVVAEILTGIFLGPTILAKYLGRVNREDTIDSLYDLYVSPVLLNVAETMGHLGLLFFMFLVGVDMEFKELRKTAGKAATVAVAGMALTFGVTTVAAFLLKNHLYADMIPLVAGNKLALYMLSVTLSATSLPVVTRILAELKLLSTDFGRIVLSAATITDVAAWATFPFFLQRLGIGTLITDMTPPFLSGPSMVIVASAVVLALLCCCARPLVWWIHRRTPEGDSVTNAYISPFLACAMLAGFLTDGMGIHYLFGGFAFGLAIPRGPVATALVERLEEFVMVVLLPLFFASTGVRTDFTLIFRPMDGTVDIERYRSPNFAITVIVILGSAAKVGGTLLAALYHSMPFNEGLSLGLLMNCRSLVEIVYINISERKRMLTNAAFPLMVLENLTMTLMVAPLVTELYRPLKSRPLIGYKRRNIQRSKPDGELRMLACVHNARNVPAFLSLLEVSNPTKRSPIYISALHLVELTGRASAMLIVHGTGDARKGKGGHDQSEHIIAAFETYEQHAAGVTVEPITAIADYSSMHDDICTAAGDRRVSIIILPFHKQLAVDGGMEEIHPAIRGLNQKVLDDSPCSVGILVDRGISGTARYAGGHHHHVAILFFGGPDDREALAYAWRMAEHPGITVTVVRFIPGADVSVPPSPHPVSEAPESRVISMAPFDTEREQKRDDEYVSEFRLRFVSDESVVYTERVVNNSEETVAAIRSLESVHDLYVVGRAHGMQSPLTAGLTEWSEHPELGPIGDLLASSDFGATVSVLVVQQYVFGSGGEAEMAESPGRQVRQYVTIANRKARGGGRSGFSTGWHDAP